MVRLPLGSVQDDIKTYLQARLKHDSHSDAIDELGEGTMRVTAGGISQV